ncbi:hypothetical protein HNO89_000726 [Sporosarcina luteola]|nr:hypothetical protein [Sporosarcina luteola]
MKWHKKNLFFLLLLSVFVLSTIPTDALAATPFKDVKEQHWASEAVEWAYNQGLTQGYPDGTFAPDKPITEAQFVTMLVRFDCSSPDSFPSSAGEHKAAGNYRYLTRHHIPLNGQTSDYAKDLPVKRGNAARIIAAYQGVDLSEAQAVYYLYMNDLATGASVSTTFKDFRPNDSLTRAEAVDVLHRISNTGACDLVGLTKRPTGSANGKYPLPKGFKADGTAYFPSPETNTKPPIGSTPASSIADVEVEKKDLSANGIDSTFVTVSFRDCNGNAIPYDQSMTVRVTSSVGATLDGQRTGSSISSNDLDAARKIVNDAWKNADVAQSNVKVMEQRVSNAAGLLKNLIEYTPEWTKAMEELKVLETELRDSRLNADRLTSYAKQMQSDYDDLLMRDTRGYSSSITSSTDGPDITVQVTAPKLTTYRTDTLTFELTDRLNACKVQPVEVHLNYLPQAELFLEEVPGFAGTKRIQAKLMLPGGQIVSNFNGKVRFRSSSSSSFSEEYADFRNGEAWTYVTPIQSAVPTRDQITAEIIPASNRYDKQLESVINRKYSIEILHDVPVSINPDCTLEKPEIAFIIDSSGSMKKNDRKRLRVSKTQELIEKLNADRNIAADFNTSGRLIKIDDAIRIRSYIDFVKESGGTNIGAGMTTAFSNMKSNGRKVAILLTDGKSTEKQIKNAITTAKNNGITVFTIGLGKERDLNKSLLKQIADETNGSFYHITDSVELGSVYQSILNEITCGIKGQTCSASSQVFSSPTLEFQGNDFFMSTDVRSNCDVAKVIVRFQSNQGDIDYELVDRGQNHFKLTRGLQELNDIRLFDEGLFIAFDRKGEPIGEPKRVIIKGK